MAEGNFDIENGRAETSRETPSENSPLVAGDDSVHSENSAQSIQLWTEMDQPWPSTFERSIGLLASPVLPKKDAELFTKSPKPGSTPIALARRSNLDRGFYSPDTRFVKPRRGTFDMAELVGSQGLSKVQSLDFASKTKEILGTVESNQLKRAKEAKAYRAEVLKKQGGVAKKTTPPLKEVTGKASFYQCAFNLANILMGVGLLALPFVFRSAGWIGGFGCILVFSAIAWRTSILIGRELNGDPRPASFFDDSPFKTPLPPGSSTLTRMLPPITSFPDIARTAFGEVGCLFISLVLYFELFSCICIFFVSIGDHLHSLFPAVSATSFAVLAALVSLLPTVILKTPALLSYLSMVGTFATIALVLSVVGSALSVGDITENVAQSKGLADDGGPHRIMWDGSGVTLALGLVAYCFSGHAIVPSIYTSMERPQDFEKMVTMTFIVVVLCCLAVATSGYIMFGNLVEDQVTLSLEEHLAAATAMKALVWLMILTGKIAI